MADLNKDDVVQLLISEGTRIDVANQYADAFKEYMDATVNIDEYGVIVKHPRTGNPMKNPFLEIRDNALKKLQAMDYVQSESLWSKYAENVEPSVAVRRQGDPGCSAGRWSKPAGRYEQVADRMPADRGQLSRAQALPADVHGL